MDKTTLIISLLIVGLIGANVYQFQNPKTVEVPAEKQQIDSTSWVQWSSVLSQRAIIDSLKQQNKNMAERIKDQSDKIANYTSITGRLKTEVDSLQQRPQWNSIPLVDNLMQRDSAAIADTVFSRSKTFGDGLFKVDGYVKVRWRAKTGLQVQQDFQLRQIRDLRLDVVTTFNEDHSRALTYVTSPDFEDLDYSTYTALESKKDIPWFWIGAGTTLAIFTGITIAF